MQVKLERGLSRRIGFGLSMAVIVFVCAELLFRLVLWIGSASLQSQIEEYQTTWYNDATPQLQYRPHPYMSYVRLDKGPLDEINRMGFYGLDHPFEKPRRTFRVVTLGGSTTAGPTAWPHQLERALQARGLTENVEVINLAMGGWTSAEAVAAFAFLGVSYAPDAVVVHLANNDLVPLREASLVPDYTHYRRMMDVEQARDGRAVMRMGLADRLDGFIAPYSSLYVYAKLWLAGPIPRRANLNSLTVWPDLKYGDVTEKGRKLFIRNIRSIAAVAEANNIRMVMTTMPYASVGHPRVQLGPGHAQDLAKQNSALRALARSEGWPLVDLETLSGELSPHFNDAIHLDVSGHEIKAHHIADGLMASGLVQKATRDR